MAQKLAFCRAPNVHTNNAKENEYKPSRGFSAYADTLDDTVNFLPYRNNRGKSNIYITPRKAGKPKKE